MKGNMKYLITGGCGFIGVNFAVNLLKRGDEVVLADNLSRKGTVSNLQYLLEKSKKVTFEHVDIRSDFEKLKLLVEDCDVVFHLAGQVAVTTSVKNPKEDFEINALGTFNLLEAVRLSNKKPTVLYASTNKVYGGMEDIVIEDTGTRYSYKDLQNGISENRLLDFHSPYGCSKGAADQYVRDYARIYDLNSAVMRQSCIYGPRQFGIEDQGWVAWFTIAHLLKKPITIFGDGKQVRDVLYVDDLFEAWDVVSKSIKKTSGQAFNVGGGPKFTLSLLEFIDLLGETTGRKVKYTFSDWRPGDQPVYVSDISKIAKTTDWKPKTTVKDGIKKMVTWISDNEALIKKNLGF